MKQELLIGVSSFLIANSELCATAEFAQPESELGRAAPTQAQRPQSDTKAQGATDATISDEEFIQKVQSACREGNIDSLKEKLADFPAIYRNDFLKAMGYSPNDPRDRPSFVEKLLEIDPSTCIAAFKKFDAFYQTKFSSITSGVDGPGMSNILAGNRTNLFLLTLNHQPKDWDTLYQAMQNIARHSLLCWGASIRALSRSDSNTLPSYLSLIDSLHGAYEKSADKDEDEKRSATYNWQRWLEVVPILTPQDIPFLKIGALSIDHSFSPMGGVRFKWALYNLRGLDKRSVEALTRVASMYLVTAPYDGRLPEGFDSIMEENILNHFEAVNRFLRKEGEKLGMSRAAYINSFSFRDLGSPQSRIGALNRAMEVYDR